jgi:hypothetical protein
VAAEAERAVDHHRARTLQCGGQQLDAPIEENGNVAG